MPLAWLSKARTFQSRGRCIRRLGESGTGQDTEVIGPAGQVVTGLALMVHVKRGLQLARSSISREKAASV